MTEDPGGPFPAHLRLSEARQAWFSGDRAYRYALARTWEEHGPTLNVVGLNPSTADERVDDPTIRRSMQVARRLRCGRLLVTNLFAWRATTPRLLKQAADPVGDENDAWLRHAAWEADYVLAAWGVHGVYRERAKAVCALLRGKRLLCLGKTKNGQPRHPLYVPAAQEPQSFLPAST